MKTYINIAIKVILSMSFIIPIFIGCSNDSVPVSLIESKPIGESIPINESKPVKDSSIKYHVEPQYDLCSDLLDGIMRTQKGIEDSARYGFIDSEGNVITDAIYEYTLFYIGASSASSGFAEGLAPVKKNGRWGYIDMTGEVKIDFKYDNAYLFSEGLAQVVMNGKCGYINKKGEIVINPAFESTSEFHNGVAVARINSKCGFINIDGNWIVTPQYDSVDFGRWDYYWTKSGLLQIEKNGLQGIAKVDNGEVKIIIQPKYTRIYPLQESEAKFVLMHKNANGEFNDDETEEGFVDSTGKEIFKWKRKDGTDYEYIVEGLRRFKNKAGKIGFADRSFHPVIQCKYDDAGSFRDGYATVYINGKMGLIDKEGNELLPFKYDVVVPNKYYGYIVVQENEQKYLISTNTLQIISDKYDEFGGGDAVIPVRKNGKIGFIDNEGKELVKPQFDDCHEYFFLGDYVWVKKNDKWIYVDKHGVQKFPESYEEVTLFTDGYASVKKNGKWGVIDLEGKIKVPFEFDKTFVAHEGLIRVLKNKKYGIIKLEK